MVKRKSSRKLNVYANLSYNRKTKRDANARKKAEYLASLPKNPIKRFFYRIRPKSVFHYWFSKKGFFTILKIIGVFLLIVTIIIGGLFFYFRKDLDRIRPGELAKRVQSTVTRYYDRNNKLLWEDKGSGNYKLVVKNEDISKYMKDATIAIEDREFYQHQGISLQGLTRAFINNAGGGDTQGGSTLTQQLVKQVFFADEAQLRGLNGIPRKIKEMILALEVERMYNKEQILALYLNESPYGGRRNGVESAAQTYFGKTAKDLNLEEAALIAAIPQNPAVFNPYNTEWHDNLLKRQHRVLDNMVEQKMVSAKEASDAKKVAIIDTIKPEADHYDGLIAPHFVLEVKQQLEEEYGLKTIREGGLTVKTTLDLDLQMAAERAISAGAEFLGNVGADNVAMSSVDVKSGQVIAMVGSVDYKRPVYGQKNVSTSLLEPGSSIKPVADYSSLFKQRSGVNYGPGSILRDENIDAIYCNGSLSGCKLRNYTGKFYWNVTIRQALAGSLNIPAVKAMYIAGVDASLKNAQDLGDKSYCIDNSSAGLSSAIGGGCTLKQIEHTNAYATFGRGGVYKPLAYILEIKNSSGEILKSWEDTGEQVIDPQVAYLITDILKDANARSITFGAQGRSFGFVVPNVISASKTGTTENGNGKAKDSWMMSYSPEIAVGVWSGNHDGSPMRLSDNTVVRRVVNNYMDEAHKIYQGQNKWQSNQDFVQPAGIKRLTINGKSDLWPSWFDKNSGQKIEKVKFDKVSKKKATSCTPQNAIEELEITKMNDPITKKDVYDAPEGYDASADDDKHQCSDLPPSITAINVSGKDNIIITVNKGTFGLSKLDVLIDGNPINSSLISGSGNFTLKYNFIPNKNTSITVNVEDQGLYTASATRQYISKN